MDAINTATGLAVRDAARLPELRQAQAMPQEGQAGRAADAADAALADAARASSPSAVVSLSAEARSEAVRQSAPSPDNGTQEARAVEQARAAAANADIRNNYSAQRALSSYEAMAQVGANAAVRPAPPEQTTAPGQQDPSVLRT